MGELRPITLTLPGQDRIYETFKANMQKSKYFSNEKDGVSILSYESGDAKDNLKAFTVLLKLKEPIKK